MIDNVLWEITWIGMLTDPHSPLYVVFYLLGSIWLYFFGIYDSNDSFEVSVTYSTG